MNILRLVLLWAVLVFAACFIVAIAGGVGTIEFLIVALVTAPLAWLLASRYDASRK